MNQYNDQPTPRSRRDAAAKGPSWSMGLLALPLVLCCALPLIVTVLATASALTKGVLVGVVVALVGTAAVFLTRRYMRGKADCCDPSQVATPSSESREAEQRP